MTQYIQMHLDRPMSMEDLCARFHVNKSTLCRRFKASVGLTVFQYILDSRLRRCRSDLAFTELSIGEIAEKYGFADTTHFSKAFKAQFDWRLWLSGRGKRRSGRAVAGIRTGLDGIRRVDPSGARMDLVRKPRLSPKALEGPREWGYTGPTNQ